MTELVFIAIYSRSSTSEAYARVLKETRYAVAPILRIIFCSLFNRGCSLQLEECQRYSHLQN